jgi:hypothetical protein
MDFQKSLILDRIAELMYESNQNFISIDLLYDDEIIGPQIRNIQIDSNFQQLINAGIITLNNFKVQFCFEKLFFYVLYINRKKKNQFANIDSIKQFLDTKSIFELTNCTDYYFLEFEDILSSSIVKQIFNSNYQSILINLFLIKINQLDISCLIIFIDIKNNKYFLITLINKLILNQKIEICNKIILSILETEESSFKYIFSETITLLKNLDIETQNKIILYAKNQNINITNYLIDYYYYISDFENALKNKNSDNLSEENIINISSSMLDSNQISNAESYILENINDIKIAHNRLELIKTYSIVLYNKTNISEAINQIKIAITDSNILYGSYHSITGGLLNLLGLYYLTSGNFEKSLNIFNSCLKNRKNIYGENHQETAIVINNIALTYFYKEDYNNSLLNFKKANLILENRFGLEHFETARSYYNIGSVLEKLENYKCCLENIIIAMKIFIRNNFTEANDFENSKILLKKITEMKPEFSIPEDLIKYL